MIDLNHPHRQRIYRKGGNTGKWIRECECGLRKEHFSGLFDGSRGAFSRAWKAAERHLRTEAAKTYEFV